MSERPIDPFETDPEQPSSGKELAAKLQAVHESQPDDDTNQPEANTENAETQKQTAMLENARAGVEAAVPEIQTEPLVADGEQALAIDLAAEEAATDEPTEPQATFRDKAADIASGRLPLVALKSKLAERRDQREDLSPAELDKQRRKGMILKGAATIGAAAATVHAVKHGLPAFVIPPSAVDKANRKITSTNIASSGAIVAPERQETVMRRALNWIERHRARKAKS